MAEQTPAYGPATTGPATESTTMVPAPCGEAELSRAQVELVKRTVANGATDDELSLFLYAARKAGLDPLMKQIHFVKRWDKKAGREVGAIQTGIDGYRLLAVRTGDYAGSDDPVYTYNDEDHRIPISATVTVWRFVHGQRCPFTATARWAEYCPDEKAAFMWHKLPHLMLGKVAEALALRKGFPVELSGVYVAEELEQAGEVIEANRIEVAAAPASGLPTGSTTGSTTGCTTSKPTARPADPETVRGWLRTKAEKNPDWNELKTAEIMPSLRGLYAGKIAEALQEKDGAGRHLFNSYIWDVTSTQDVPDKAIRATLAWLCPIKDETGDYPFAQHAVPELQAIVKLARIQAGQTELPLKEEIKA